MSFAVVFNKKYNEYIAIDIVEIGNLYNLSKNNQYDNITCIYISKLNKILNWKDNGINELPKSLELLSIKDTHFTPIKLPKNLRILRLENCNIKRIDDIPVGLEELIISDNKLRVLESLPLKLRKLDCQNNKICYIDELPDSLTDLNCRDNAIQHLPDLPDSLEVLNCYNNALKSIPELPKKLKYLICDFNMLTGLPELPESLEYLDCSSNMIESLPKLPKNMYNLDCCYNRIKELPGELPSRLDNFYCNNNDIEEMPFSFVKLECLKSNPFLKEKPCKKDDINPHRKFNPDITNTPLWKKLTDDYSKHFLGTPSDENVYQQYLKDLRKNIV